MAPASPVAGEGARTQSSQLRVASIKEERSASSSASDENDSDSAVRAVRPLTIDVTAAGTVNGTSLPGAIKSDANGTEVRVKALATAESSHQHSESAVRRQTSLREPKLLAVARGLVRNTLSPRARAATVDTGATAGSSNNTATASAKATPVLTTGFGKFRRSSTSAKGELSKNTVPVGSLETQRSTRQRSVDSKLTTQPAPQRSLSRVAGHETSTDNDTPAGAVPDASPSANAPASEPRESNDAAMNDASSSSVSEEAGHGFVDEVCKTLDDLVAQLDSVDPKKLYAIRLGGELRGLLGKAQDEFYAYESAFLEHANQVGVSIALQNFSASLAQVFAIVTRLQSAKALFLLNKKFKREVLFAFQEINSYYTSLFMELSMAVAKRSGIVLPLPSPVKPPPPPPVLEQSAVVETILEPVKGAISYALGFESICVAYMKCLLVMRSRLCAVVCTLETAPALPTADALCLEAHQYFYGHRKTKDLAKAVDLYTVRPSTCFAQSVSMKHES